MAGSLGAYIKRRRIELGLTQVELTERMEAQGHTMSQGHISKLENGESKLPQPIRLQALAKALEVTPVELLERSGWGTATSFFQESVEDYDELSPPKQELVGLISQLSDDDAHSLLRVVRPMVRGQE